MLLCDTFCLSLSLGPTCIYSQNIEFIGYRLGYYVSLVVLDLFFSKVFVPHTVISSVTVELGHSLVDKM
jgi:hypothetical protein